MQLIETSIPNFTLRFAAEPDVPLILSFINELAKYEKMSGQVEANEKLLNKNLFGDTPQAEVIVAEYENKPVGFALFFHNFSTFVGKPGLYLEDVFIKAEHRSRGFGTEILKYLANLAIERNCGRFEWAVLDWNESAIEFYKGLGAKPMNDWTVYRLADVSLQKLSDKWENQVDE